MSRLPQVHGEAGTGRMLGGEWRQVSSPANQRHPRTIYRAPRRYEAVVVYAPQAYQDHDPELGT